MKNIVVLFAPSVSLHMFDKKFDGLSAYEKALLWAKDIPDLAGIFIFADGKTSSACAELNKKNEMSRISVVEKPSWTVSSLLHSMHEACRSSNAQNIVYAWADCPFLNTTLTLEVIKTHSEYIAEYTFADGYPYGFAPELINCDTAAIIEKLSLRKDIPNAAGDNPVSRDSIFSAMKTDINAFEIETVISPVDWRMYRLSFHCASKEGLLACLKLAEISCGKGGVEETAADKAVDRNTGAENTDKNFSAKPAGTGALSGASAEELSEMACKCAGILRTVPGFYNIQIEAKSGSRCVYSPYDDVLEKTKKKFGEMPLEKFKALVKNIADFSENAVLSLSLWGEPLYHKHIKNIVSEVLKYPGLSVFIETTGDGLSETLAAQIAEICGRCAPRTNGYEPVMWVVLLDSVTKEKYKEIHFADGFEAALNGINILSKYFPKSVYPQFVRMDINEDQLEAFYRFWSAKDSPSHGNLIIQKYNSYLGLLPERKPCDLSPVERYPDWHLRRDMVILSDGSVPLYKECMFDDIIGNVFEEPLEVIWHKSDRLMEDQINKKYDKISGTYDEYYTFNF
ncbi:spiro-SPASM protein [Treponema parvum]|uniref:Spiro-SPASM protein n=1 Tax=Treponema parvum TaxID=138851 RepID=A0A975IDB6_9SPIR|nr:spiro-SPASM protein [Treponema parvum]QTQ11954.1 spiro-SPASM protein [Treponema parvum]QTQ16068.1 spiro-SPASM protein [Treponema parvum]